MKKKSYILGLVVLMGTVSWVTAAVAVQKNDTDLNGRLSLKAAIFVQNRAGSDFQDKLETFKDLIAARLTEKGFSIMDSNDVLAKFQESPQPDGGMQAVVDAAVDMTKAVKTEAHLEDLLNDASALRLAQMLGVDYLVFATITSSGQEAKTFSGQGTDYGTDNSVTDHIMRLTLKVCEGAHGGTVYADVVKVTERIAQSQNLKIASIDTVNKLLDSGAVLAADNISAKVGQIREAKVDQGAEVEFAVKSNVEGATVELDGAAIGSTPGRFRALQGLHQLRLSKERYATWEKTVNISPDQNLNVSMELAQEGIQRLDETSDIENKKLITEGEKNALDKSYVHDDGIGHEIKAIIHGGK